MARLKEAAQEQRIKTLEAELKAERKTSEKLSSQLEIARGARKWKVPAPAKPKKLKGDTVRVAVSYTHLTLPTKRIV